MKTEIDHAINFLSNMVRNRNIDPDQLTRFRESLLERLVARFTNHWFPDRPLRGNAYRCIRIVNYRMDSLLAAAGEDAGLAESLLWSAFPAELTVWIDPEEVSYRIGEDGSIGVLYPANTNQNNLDECSVNNNTYSSRNSSPILTKSLPGSPIIMNGKKFRSGDSGLGSSTQSSRNASRTSTPSPMSVTSLPASPMSATGGCRQAGYQSTERISPNTVNEAYIAQQVYCR